MRSITLLSTAAVLAGVQVADAQFVRRWDRSTNGEWDVPTNWSPPDVPNTNLETAVLGGVGRYDVNFRRSMIVRGIEIPNPDATLNVHAGCSLYTNYLSANVLEINGTLAINPTGENYFTEFGDCSAEYPSTRLVGNGTIRLNAHPENPDSARLVSFCQTRALEISSSSKIAGAGRIFRDIDNYGEIAADVKDRVLELAGDTRNITGGIFARNGSTLRISGDLSGWGLPGIVVEDSASVVEYAYGEVSYCTLSNDAGGVSRVVGYVNWFDVTLAGTHEIDNHLTIHYRLANNGTLYVGRSGTYATLELGAGFTSIVGAGQIVLRGGGIDGQKGYYPTESFVIGQGQALAGTGYINAKCMNSGSLSPGLENGEIGTIQLNGGEWRQEPDAVLLVDAAGAQVGQYDRITGTGSLVWSGTLKFRLVGGYVPVFGDRFTLARHTSSEGTFSHVELPTTNTGVWRVIYDRASTVLLLTCATDLDNDADTDLSDLAILLRNFASSDAEPIEGDINADRRVDVQDLALLLGAFGQRCR